MAINYAYLKGVSLCFQIVSSIVLCIGIGSPYWTWIGDKHRGLWKDCDRLSCLPIATSTHYSPNLKTIQGFMCASLGCSVISLILCITWYRQPIRKGYTLVTTLWIIFNMVSGVTGLTGVLTYFILGVHFSYLFCLYSSLISVLTALGVLLQNCCCHDPPAGSKNHDMSAHSSSNGEYRDDPDAT